MIFIRAREENCQNEKLLDFQLEFMFVLLEINGCFFCQLFFRILQKSIFYDENEKKYIYI